MSFIKDLIAWKSRPGRHAAAVAGDDPAAVDPAEFDEDGAWDEDDDDGADEADRGILDDPAPADSRKIPPVQPAVATAEPVRKGTRFDPDGADVDALLARLNQRSARLQAAAEVPKMPASPPKIWEMNVGPAADAPRHAPVTEPRMQAFPGAAPAAAFPPRPAGAVQAPPAASPAGAGGAAGPAQWPAGRAKTRLLGFQAPDAAVTDPMAGEPAAPGAGPVRFPTGWLVVVEGPGRGACFTLGAGVSQIGRGEDQTVRLDFGDQAISRQGHAAVAFDTETGRFFLGHGGKLNLVRLNDRPVLTTEELASNDRIRIGETVLQFIAFCGESFSWNDSDAGGEAGRDSAVG